MKKLYLLIALMAMVGCQKSDFPINNIGKSKTTIKISIPQSSTIETRALQNAAETKIYNLWVFVFDASNKLIEKHQATDIDHVANTASIPIIAAGTGLNIYACANVSSSDMTAFDAYVAGTTTVATLKAITSAYEAITALNFPMSGELLNHTFNTGDNVLPITLNRSAARIDIVTAGLANFVFGGIETMLNMVSEATIFPGALNPSPANNTTHISPADKSLPSMYLYENAITATTEAEAEDKATAVVFKGTYKGIEGYYKLRIKYDTPVKYNIHRNTIYSLNVTKVTAPGFATAADAVANFPQNVEYSVTSTDPDTSDLVTSNGQYYLGVSNSEYAIYASGAQTGLTIATLTHNATAALVSNGTITATAGITLRSDEISTTTQKQTIIADLSDGFTDGTITLRLGNLLKVITVKQRDISFLDAVIADFSTTEYVQAELETPTATWVKLGADATTPLTAPKLHNPAGGIYLHIASNFNGVARHASLIINSRDSKGRAKIELHQPVVALQYVSGVPAFLERLKPTPVTITALTNIPGWSIVTYQGVIDEKHTLLTPALTDYTEPAQIGGPVANYSVTAQFADNPKSGRNISFYITAPGFSEIFITTIVQYGDNIIGMYGGWNTTSKTYTKLLQVEPMDAADDPALIHGDAVRHCRNKGDGWYLPGPEQLFAIWVTYNSFAPFSTVPGRYWGAEETQVPGIPLGRTLSIKDGTIFSRGVELNDRFKVRCVRDVSL